MSHEELFDALDLEHDGFLSRDELGRAASLWGWHWRQAPFHALLDFMTIHAPLSRELFMAAMDQVDRDPDGIYGSVLERFPPRTSPRAPSRGPLAGTAGGASSVSGHPRGCPENLLMDLLPEDAARTYGSAIRRLNVCEREISADDAGLLIIDPQRSFTSGEWMWSLGATGMAEVMPIAEAFHVCALMLSSLPRRPELMFTRCPFPPESYGWDDALQAVVEPDQHYFIKPGNSVLEPASNGFRQWVQRLLAEGRNTLVMGGCTLNSCVRVSAKETFAVFREQGLRLVVDLSLCGARASNYHASPLFGGMSAVEAALAEMDAAGVVLAQRLLWV
jgi:nicotinamidase-related amidase